MNSSCSGVSEHSAAGGCGLPCHVRINLCYVFGVVRTPITDPSLICGVYSFHLIDYLASAAGVAPSCSRASPRDKQAYGWPGDISVYAGGEECVFRQTQAHREEQIPSPTLLPVLRPDERLE